MVSDIFLFRVSHPNNSFLLWWALVIVSRSVKWKASQVSTRPVQRTLCKALGKKFECSSLSITELWNAVLVHLLLIKAQVTHYRLKTNIEGNKTDMSHFSCSLSSLLGFWVVLEPFRVFFFFFLFLFQFSSLQLLKERRLESPTIAEKHDWTRSRLSRENRKALEFGFGRAK